MPKLVVLSEGFTGRSCELKMDKVTIGRVEDNAFQIPEPSVSSHHCEIFLRGKDVVIKDLDSTNGTYIDGDKVTEAILKYGQVLRLGQVELRLDDGTGATPTAAAAAPTKKKVEAVTTGIKLNELEIGSSAKGKVTDSAFKKKSNKVNLYFMIGGIVLGIIVVAVLVLKVMNTGGTN